MNSQAGNSKKVMFLKKRIDYDLPQNIMTMVSMWIDCYNSTIREKTKSSMHYEFETRINDTDLMASSKKMSSSCKRTENDKIKIQNDIFKWLASMDDKNVDFYSVKLGDLMGMDKGYIIKMFVNNYRVMNRMKEFNPNYLVKDVQVSKLLKPTPLTKVEEKDSSSASFSFRSEKLLSLWESSQGEIPEVDPQGKDEKKDDDYVIDKNGKIIRGDAWDM